MRIMITGGCGFLGSNLVKRLLSDGHSVTVLDNMQTSVPGRSADLEKLGAQVRECDITEQLPIGLRDEARFDRIYHLACAASPPKYQINPVHTLLTNVIGTKNILDYAFHTGGRVLLSSTSEVYGDPLEHPQKETYRGNVNPYGPRACYDEGKRAAETLMYEAKGIETQVVRIFNTYGPLMDPTDGRVVSNFINQALRGDDITIYGDGTQTRSICYVDDLIDGLIAAMESGYERPVNLGNPTEMSMNTLALAIRDIVGTKSAIVHKPLPMDDPTVRCPDISLAKRVLDWEPKVTPSEGLVKTVEYFRSIA